MKAKRWISVLLVLCMLLGAFPVSVLAADNDVSFSDVTPDHWYYDSVAYAYEAGLMDGTGDGNFSPELPTTRGMIVTILHRMEKTPAAVASDFSDVERSAYYAAAVDWAAANAIVTGYDADSFGPNDLITREQLAAILFRYAKYKNMDVSVGENTNILSYDDAFDISAYAIPAIQWACGAGLISGVGNGRLDPKGTATRAQVATILERFCDDEESSEEKPDIIIEQGPVENGKEWTVTFELIFADAVTNLDAFREQKVKDGKCVEKPADPIIPVAEFLGWYTTTDYAVEYDFATPVTSDCTIYAKWDADDTDTDQDGLYDVSESYIGTDLNKIDTDQDGLTDYQEVMIGTSPLKQDTDSDGVLDCDEDADEDGLTNATEYVHGSDPTVMDSDYDGLNDGEEVNTYQTEPDNSDTDGDGGEDGWEVENGYNPLAANQSFVAQVNAEAPSASEPVTAGVKLTLSGKAAATLDVEPVSDAENPLLSPFIPGYLGNAFEFNVEGEFDEAELTFRYDPALGTPDNDFQPRIYHFNEAEGTLEEVENQTVVDGKVTAKVTHFSSYILLNKVEFDKVWTADIKPPISNEDGGEVVLDIAFVIDNSSSMNSNDPNELSKKLTEEFIEKLRDGKDQAAVIMFDKYAEELASLTSDKDVLKKAVDMIDFSGGWTNGSDGVKNGIDQLKNSNSNHRFIIFLTDGQDNKHSYVYDNLIAEANLYNIKIFSIGMGSASTSVLEKLANETGGKYYYATASSGAEDLEDLNTVFKDIEEGTIDLTTDTNRDGIPDYYNDLILRGELALSNGSTEFTGIDFNYDADGNPSDDYDGDGLRNGAELKLKYKQGENGKKQVYVTMYSDPLKEHSDADGVSDYEESKRKSNPLIADFDGNAVHSLSRNDGWYYRQFVELYEEDAIFRAEQALFGAGLTKGFRKIAEEELINFFYNYSSKEQVEKDQAMSIALTTSETISTIISGLLDEIKYLKKALDVGSDIYGTISEAEVFERTKEIADLIAEYKELGSELYKMATYDAEWYEAGVVEAMTDLLELHYVKAINKTMELSKGEEILGNVWLKIDDFSSKYKKFMKKEVVSGITISDTITLVDLVVNIVDGVVTVSKVNAAKETFERNFDILEKLRKTADHDAVSKAAQNVINAMGKGTGSYYQELAEVVAEETGKVLIEEIADKVLEKNVVYATWKVAMTVLKITGFDDEVKSVYVILCYSDLIDAAQSLTKKEVKRVDTANGSYFFYEVKEEKVQDVYRYLTTAAQALMLAEKKYVDHPRTPDYNQENAKSNIKYIKKNADTLKLPISEKLWKHVS